MPIYAYRCEACGHAKDVLQKVSDAPLTVCPACGAAAFKKQVTAAGFQLKGSGWYVTDFKGGSAAGAPKDEAEGGKGKEEPKADNKADNKSETAKTEAAPAPAPAAAAPSAPSAAPTPSPPSTTPSSGQ